jgi:hypothetical protein
VPPLPVPFHCVLERAFRTQCSIGVCVTVSGAEVWIEKTTMNSILLPLARRFEFNPVTASGEISQTACRDLVDRVQRSGRACKALYVSDFDNADQRGAPIGRSAWRRGATRCGRDAGKSSARACDAFTDQRNDAPIIYLGESSGRTAARRGVLTLAAAEPVLREIVENDVTQERLVGARRHRPRDDARCATRCPCATARRRSANVGPQVLAPPPPAVR